MEYLKANINDIEECQKLKNEIVNELNESGLHIWNDEYPSDNLIKEDILNSNGRIIKENNKIIAYASIDSVINEFQENVFKEENLYSFARLMVKKEYRGKHVASFLINNLLNEMKDIGAAGCGILVHPINEIALKVYYKLGFKLEEIKVYPFGEFYNLVYIF